MWSQAILLCSVVCVFSVLTVAQTTEQPIFAKSEILTEFDKQLAFEERSSLTGKTRVARKKDVGKTDTRKQRLKLAGRRLSFERGSLGTSRRRRILRPRLMRPLVADREGAGRKFRRRRQPPPP